MRFYIPAGTGCHLGRPARPLDRQLVDALAALLGSFTEVEEAHLPQCWVQAIMNDPAQVLVVVFRSESAISGERANEIETGISMLLKRDSHLDVWFITPSDPLLDPVRRTGCKIFERGMPR